jgi:hypothetical protein
MLAFILRWPIVSGSNSAFAIGYIDRVSRFKGQRGGEQIRFDTESDTRPLAITRVETVRLK